jgi:hypothetical protein
MAYGAWYSDLVSAGKQVVSDTSKTLTSTGQQVLTQAQKTAQQTVTSAAQKATQAATSTIQKGAQTATSAIGVKTPAPTPAKTPAPAPAPAPAPVRVPAVIAKPVEAVKQNPMKSLILLAAVGAGVWYFFLRKK